MLKGFRDRRNEAASSAGGLWFPPMRPSSFLLLNLAAGMKAGYAFPGRPVPPPPAIARVPAARVHCPGMFSRSLRTGRPSEMPGRRVRAAKVNVLARLTSTLHCGKREKAAKRGMAKEERKGKARSENCSGAGRGRPEKAASGKCGWRVEFHSESGKSAAM